MYRHVNTILSSKLSAVNDYLKTLNKLPSCDVLVTAAARNVSSSRFAIFLPNIISAHHHVASGISAEDRHAIRRQMSYRCHGIDHWYISLVCMFVTVYSANILAVPMFARRFNST